MAEPTTNPLPAPPAPRPAPARRNGSPLVLVLVSGSVIGLLGLGLAALAWRTRWSPPTVERAEALVSEKRFREAANEAEAVLTERPEETRARLALARARTGLGEATAAIEALRGVPDWSLHKAKALLFEGQALRRLPRGRAAERAFLACVARDPDGPFGMTARIELLKLYAMQERIEAFKALFWEIYPRLPDDDRLLLLTMRTKIEFEQTRPEINAQTLRAMAVADPQDAYARSGLAAALDRSGDLAAARAWYQQALALAPSDAELRERTMSVLQRMGDLAGLKAILAARPEGADDRAGTQQFLGLVAESSGDLAAAEAAFARAVAAEPTDPRHRHRHALVLYRLGRKAEADAEAAARTRQDEALKALRDAWNAFATPFETDPRRIDPALLHAMARACEAVGWPREASAWEREASRLATAPSA